MDASDKPFICDEAADYSLRFLGEERSTRLKFKPETQLPFNGRPKLNPTISAILYEAGLPDQTPTPTRFLRNCEEIGLFQDLNKNPFDDDFRKATESLSQEGSALNSPNALDQSESADMEMTNQPSLSLTNNLELVPSMSPGRGEDTNNGIIQLVDNETSMAMVRRMLAVDHTSLMVHLPSGQLMPFNLPTQPAAGSWEATPVSQQVVPIPTAASVLPRDPCSRNTSPSASTLTKLRLKAVLKQNMGLADGGQSVADTSSNSQATHNAEVHIQKQDADTSSSSLGKRIHNDDPAEDEKRQKFLERNRAAAAKCRAKKKMWLDNIESKADEMASKIRSLEKENSRLRDEVSQLKTLLLAHTDCPVTQLQLHAGQLFINGDQVTVARSSQSQKSRSSGSRPSMVKPMMSIAPSTSIVSLPDMMTLPLVMFTDDARLSTV